MEGIINEWHAELEKRAREFQRQAAALAAWDRRILQQRSALLHLEEQLRKVLIRLNWKYALPISYSVPLLVISEASFLHQGVLVRLLGWTALLLKCFQAGWRLSHRSHVCLGCDAVSLSPSPQDRLLVGPKALHKKPGKKCLVWLGLFCS